MLVRTLLSERFVSRFDSSRSVIVEDEERDTSLVPEKRSRLDSNSTDVEPGFEVELGGS